MPHDHDHGAALDLGAVDLGPAFRLAVGLNVGYVVIEAAFGFWTGSLALLADAAHNLADVAGLLVAWGASTLGQRSGTSRYTWGFGRATILAALFNAVTILIGVGLVIREAVLRFSDPVEVPGLTVMAVALVGIVVNAASALLFARARRTDLNARGAYLHMAADAAVSGGVVLAAGGVVLTGWLWLDPAVAIVVSALIAVTAWDLLRGGLQLGLDGVPDSVDRAAVADWLAAQPGVVEVHDLHIWALSTTRTALAAHVVLDDGNQDAFLADATETLARRFHIEHATLQIERAPCANARACLAE